jgi:hypothetical protein
MDLRMRGKKEKGDDFPSAFRVGIPERFKAHESMRSQNRRIPPVENGTDAFQVGESRWSEQQGLKSLI